MNFKPNDITREHVLSAIKIIEEENIELIPSTRFLVEINGKNYPPKEVMRYAHQQLNGEKVWEYSGGDQTNKILDKMGFKIIEKNVDPIKGLIDQYKAHLKQNGIEGEDYKWKLLSQFRGKPDVNAKDFYAEIKGINFANLIYPVAVTVIHHIARDRTELYRECLRNLFVENTPLQVRVSNFNAETLRIYRELEKKLPHHHDERTIATFLTYHNPDRYSFFKDSFYQKYCEIIGVKPKPRGEKYSHYLELVDNLISDYISVDDELISLINRLLPDDAFPDSNHRVLAQDILFQTLDRQMGAERNYWRIGTTDGSTSYWEMMKNNNKVCIGWPEIGDLNKANVDSRKDIEKLLKSNGYYKNDNRNLSRKSGEILDFLNNIKTKDIVLAQDGSAILGLGLVKDEYHYVQSETFAHQREVEWKILEPDLKNNQGLRTTVYRVTDMNLINQIEEMIESKKISGNRKMKQPLNQILFGPPGTGKTYNTVNKALEIIGENLDGKSRPEIKALFDAKLKEGRIVFTTFHQSMSYEDFIEGIKPTEPKQEGLQVNYKIIDGVFKKVCAIAGYQSYRLFNQSTTDSSKYTYDDLYDAFINSIQEQIKNGKPPTYKSITGKDVEVKEININDSIIARAKTSISSNSAPLTKENLQKLYDKFKSIDEIQDLQQVKDTVQITPRITEFYAVFSGLKQFENNYKTKELLNRESNETEVLDYNEIQKKFNAGVYNDAIKVYGKKAEPIILIIDEINRGNVSQIFGELITLIEEDKRLGNEEALEATLPYSKDKFGVPPNLYIIGTMNTADRSVEALDTALRRRFSFEEIPPIPELIASAGKLKNENGLLKGIELSVLLNTMNKRIEKLLDKDHLIGHSYFMSIINLEELKAVFQNKIIPLLQEYFFGDYGKIGLVLGKGFFETIESQNENLFANFDDYDAAEFAERTIYKLKNISSMSDNEFIQTINLIMQK